MEPGKYPDEASGLKRLFVMMEDNGHKNELMLSILPVATFDCSSSPLSEVESPSPSVRLGRNKEKASESQPQVGSFFLWPR